MSFLAWIVIAAKIVNKQGEGFFLDTILGIVGAVAGGRIFTAFGGARLFSMLEAAVGAVVVAGRLPCTAESSITPTPG